MEQEGSFEVGDNMFSPGYFGDFLSTLDWDFQIDPLSHHPSPPPPPSPSHHMNIDLPQSSLAELSSDAGFPIDQLSSPPPLPSYHMNIDLPQSSLAAELQPPSSGDSVSSTVRPVPTPLPGQTDRPRSGIEEELQAWRLPDLPSTPTGRELLLNHLRPASERLPLKHISQPRRLAVVNADLPVMNPQELPGVDRGEGRIGIHYLTDNLQLCFAHNTRLLATERGKKFTLETRDGYWTQRDWAVVCGDLREMTGLMKTFDFRTKSGTKTKWIMNVYSLIDDLFFVEDGLALCHVFQQDSTGYKRRSKCPTFQRGQCDGLFHGPDRRSDPRVAAYMEDFAKLLLGDPDPDTSTDTTPTADHGQSKKRKKNSEVWDYFTKIFAHDIEGNMLTFAVCNHCSNVLTACSSGGTTHLARHACPCKLKPVEAGRNYKAGISVSSS